MQNTDIPKFKQLNNNLSINVFELQNIKDEKNIIVPLYISKNNPKVVLTVSAI